MKFTCNGIVYQGFTRYHFGTKLGPNDRVVLVHCEGDVDLWVAESQDGFLELQRYYQVEVPPTFQLLMSVDTPMWVVDTSTINEDLGEDDVTFGPFYCEQGAKNFAENKNVEAGNLYSNVVKLEKP